MSRVTKITLLAEVFYDVEVGLSVADWVGALEETIITPNAVGPFPQFRVLEHTALQSDCYVLVLKHVAKGKGAFELCAPVEAILDHMDTWTTSTLILIGDLRLIEIARMLRNGELTPPTYASIRTFSALQTAYTELGQTETMVRFLLEDAEDGMDNDEFLDIVGIDRFETEYNEGRLICAAEEGGRMLVYWDDDES